MGRRILQYINASRDYFTTQWPSNFVQKQSREDILPINPNYLDLELVILTWLCLPGLWSSAKNVTPNKGQVAVVDPISGIRQLQGSRGFDQWERCEEDNTHYVNEANWFSPDPAQENEEEGASLSEKLVVESV